MTMVGVVKARPGAERDRSVGFSAASTDEVLDTSRDSHLGWAVIGMGGLVGSVVDFRRIQRQRR